MDPRTSTTAARLTRTRGRHPPAPMGQRGFHLGSTDPSETERQRLFPPDAPGGRCARRTTSGRTRARRSASGLFHPTPWWVRHLTRHLRHPFPTRRRRAFPTRASPMHRPVDAPGTCSTDQDLLAAEPALLEQTDARNARGTATATAGPDPLAPRVACAWPARRAASAPTRPSQSARGMCAWPVRPVRPPPAG